MEGEVEGEVEVKEVEVEVDGRENEEANVGMYTMSKQSDTGPDLAPIRSSCFNLSSTVSIPSRSSKAHPTT